jgi:hypothetical protein
MSDEDSDSTASLAKQQTASNNKKKNDVETEAGTAVLSLHSQEDKGGTKNKHEKKHKKQKKEKKKKKHKNEKKEKKETKKEKSKMKNEYNNYHNPDNDNSEIVSNAGKIAEHSSSASSVSSHYEQDKTVDVAPKEKPAGGVNDDDDGDNSGNDENENVMMQQVIPKKKRPQRSNRTDTSTNMENSQHTSDDDGRNMEVSLNELKRRVLGRDLKTDEDSDAEHDDELKKIRSLMNPIGSNSNADGSKFTALADKLRNDLMCAVCHDVVYPPISLRCGHSFCQPCVEWWFDRVPSCPTCRQSVSEGRKYIPAPNLALRACVMSIFGQEIVSRLQSSRPKGERGGAHDAGYVVLSELDKERWHYLQVHQSKAWTDAGMVQARRNIVLDADDQRMQLALSVFGRLEKVLLEQTAPGFRIKLCLLTMEEDEVEDSGFPIDIVNQEDEQLICGREGRFLHSFLDVHMKTDNDERQLPLARVSSDENGYFDYLLDPSQSAGNPNEARILIFEHSDTGCCLEVDLAQLQSRAGGGQLQPQRQPRNREHSFESETSEEEIDRRQRLDRNRRGGFVMGEDDDSDMGSVDEFEQDGFLIPDQNVGSDVEGAFSDDNDEDLCAICEEDGQLIVCDGGDEDDGCGKGFHIRCINRQEIPEGDWICQECAKSCGIAVGQEGHEFPPKKRGRDSDEEDQDNAKKKSESKKSAGKRKVIDESDSDHDTDAVPTVDSNTSRDQTDSQQNTKPKRRHVLEESDSE